MAMTELLHAAQIEISFGSRKVLDGVALSIAPGEAIALIGPNGAGKSTLMKILSGLIKPDAGQIRLQGDPLQNLPRREIARRIAMVPQGAPQVFDYGLLDFVLMGYYARSSRFALPSSAEIEGAKNALQTLGLSTLAGHAVSSLSGGELQRALMARALVSKSPLWLLDEPTASLDMRHQIALLEVMKKQVRAGGAAIAILHDLSLVHRFFHRVIVLKDGVFIADGPPEKALQPDLVSTAFGVSMKRGLVAGKNVWVVA